jgi:protein-disulfide isomerase
MGADLCLAFRHFPFSQIHPNELHAAFAAETADLQDTFWETHGLLFAHQEALEDSEILNYAVLLELQMDSFVTDFSSPYVHQEVRKDFMGDVRRGVNGTPTFFVNGQRYNGVSDYNHLLVTLQKVTQTVEGVR